jgi:hypothetical protein
LPEMEDPVEASAHQEHDIGVLHCRCAGRRNRERMVVGQARLHIGEFRNRIWVRSIKCRGIRLSLLEK